eukprot:6139-Pelagomonas_calceolata.AAC.2
MLHLMLRDPSCHHAPRLQKKCPANFKSLSPRVLDRGAGNRFQRAGTRLKTNERFCIQCVVKRAKLQSYPQGTGTGRQNSGMAEKHLIITVIMGQECKRAANALNL